MYMCVSRFILYVIYVMIYELLLLVLQNVESTDETQWSFQLPGLEGISLFFDTPLPPGNRACCAAIT